jgi:hypothetical protein
MMQSEKSNNLKLRMETPKPLPVQPAERSDGLTKLNFPLPKLESTSPLARFEDGGKEVFGQAYGKGVE